MKFEHLLVGVDPTPAAARAIERASELLAPGGRLTLLHVVDARVLAFGSVHGDSGRILRNRRLLERQALEELERRAEPLRAAGLDVATQVEFGRPADVLVERSAEGVDLLVLGAHGRTAVVQLVLGSVAEEVVRGAHPPALIVHDVPGATRPTRVLAAVVPDEAGRAVLERADAIARRLGVPLEVLHALEPAPTPLAGEGFVLPPYLADPADRERDVQRLVGATLGRPITAEVRLLVGPPAPEVANAAGPADLVVCGIHRRVRLERLLFGSVAPKLIRWACGPVLTVPLER